MKVVLDEVLEEIHELILVDYLHYDIAIHFGMSKQSVKLVNIDICKQVPKLIGCHNHIP